ncbi:MAG: serine/threonine protein phosphatase, partial [Deltaproteobacteria bacterium]|nr:serine/threonine protein phosphatase [Deltaproteobacteria bacterium]
TSDLVQCIMGNHESIFLDFLNGADIRAFLVNGGDTTLQSYRAATDAAQHQLVPAEHVTFLKSLKLWIELEDYFVVHAGFQPGVDIRSQSLQDLIWIRDPFLFSEYDFGKKVIFGHTPFSEPFIMDNKIGLDTGAVYGNKLTCLELPAMRFYSVNAFR